MLGFDTLGRPRNALEIVLHSNKLFKKMNPSNENPRVVV